MSSPVYVGELFAVRVAGETADRDVQWVALGVMPKKGLVTAEDRKELARGVIYAKPPGGRRYKMTRLCYRRERRQGKWWYHDTPNAYCRLVRARGSNDPPFAWLDSRDSLACGPEAFICE